MISKRKLGLTLVLLGVVASISFLGARAYLLDYEWTSLLGKGNTLMTDSPGFSEAEIVNSVTLGTSGSPLIFVMDGSCYTVSEGVLYKLSPFALKVRSKYDDNKVILQGAPQPLGLKDNNIYAVINNSGTGYLTKFDSHLGVMESVSLESIRQQVNDSGPSVDNVNLVEAGPEGGVYIGYNNSAGNEGLVKMVDMEYSGYLNFGTAPRSASSIAFWKRNYAYWGNEYWGGWVSWFDYSNMSLLGKVLLSTPYVSVTENGVYFTSEDKQCLVRSPFNISLRESEGSSICPDGPIIISFAVDRENVYVQTQTPYTLHKLDAETLEEVDSTNDIPPKSIPFGSDNNFYVLDDNRDLAVYSKSNLEKLDTVNFTTGDLVEWAYKSIANGMVYFGDFHGTYYAIGNKISWAEPKSKPKVPWLGVFLLFISIPIAIIIKLGGKGRWAGW